MIDFVKIESLVSIFESLDDQLNRNVLHTFFTGQLMARLSYKIAQTKGTLVDFWQRDRSWEKKLGNEIMMFG